ncbi:MAG: hypothetical protein H6981_02945 [Gammaproteobacteria bacterium]|nr:hypothetical protein [Gammaproteobacteria bacterium]MCP5135746.1 hypothetical protein [Gammaproteobacteria bacterium]
MNDEDPTPKTVKIGERTYQLVKRADGAGMELVRAHPDDTLDEDAERRRVGAVAAYEGYRSSPRAHAPANIDQPLDKRTETVLSHQADSETRAMLNGAVQPPPNRGRK